MGYLHEGHLSLVRRAREECDHVVVSIFVNPTQFGPKEDLSKYPRDLDRDLSLLASLGVDLVWIPTAEIMYPQGYQTWVEVERITGPLEGGMRPGHFKGVTTVVAKLFNGVQPYKAYFGQKDAQQAAVIRQMTRDLNFPIEIVVCPIVREPDGLAMSSRNTNLDPQARRDALAISRWLAAVRARFAAGERDADALLADAAAALAPGRVDYASLVDADDLQPVATVTRPALVAVAAFFGGVRLIDNTVLST
jgi:pantoate--beta-alanine ligase